MLNKVDLKTIELTPEETLEEMYIVIDGEGEFHHRGFHYTFGYAKIKEKLVYEICIQDLNGEYADLDGWEECIPREFFDSPQDLVFNFKLKNDGRTLAEYICDYYGKPRILL